VIFGVCGMAQGVASVSAIEDALGCGTTEDVKLAREIIVKVETVREHVLRVALDWSRWLGEASPPQADDVVSAALRTVTAAPRRLCAALFGGASSFEVGAKLAPDWPVITGIVDDMELAVRRLVFGVSPAAWLSECRGSVGEGLECWAERGMTVAARMVAEIAARDWRAAGCVEPHFLQGLTREAVLARLLSPTAHSFVAAPEWNGAPCETGAMVRESDSGLVRSVVACWGAGLLARLTARLVEMARSIGVIRGALQQIMASSEPSKAGRSGDAVGRGDGVRLGASQVQAARGLLVHAVELHGARVGRYWIVAPTEWNFHPKGVAARALTGLRTTSEAELRRQAELIVHAIDPCVACDLRVA
jgi:Ni,Fe-hydrogenase I large subunit